MSLLKGFYGFIKYFHLHFYEIPQRNDLEGEVCFNSWFKGIPVYKSRSSSRSSQSILIDVGKCQFSHGRALGQRTLARAKMYVMFQIITQQTSAQDIVPKASKSSGGTICKTHEPVEGIDSTHSCRHVFYGYKISQVTQWKCDNHERTWKNRLCSQMNVHFSLGFTVSLMSPWKQILKIFKLCE